MRFGFRALPDPGHDGVRGRPIVDVVIEGLEIAPQVYGPTSPVEITGGLVGWRVVARLVLLFVNKLTY